MLGFDLVTFLDRLHAGAHVGRPVDVHEAVGTVARDAEQPAGPVILEAAGKDPDPGGQQGRGNRVPRVGIAGLAVEAEGDPPAAVQNLSRFRIQSLHGSPSTSPGAGPGFSQLMGPEATDHLVGGDNAPGQKPAAATRGVEPPLQLFPGMVLSEIAVAGPIPLRRPLRGPLLVFPGTVELVGRTGSAVGTVHQRRTRATPVRERAPPLSMGRRDPEGGQGAGVFLPPLSASCCSWPWVPVGPKAGAPRAGDKNVAPPAASSGRGDRKVPPPGTPACFSEAPPSSMGRRDSREARSGGFPTPAIESSCPWLWVPVGPKEGAPARATGMSPLLPPHGGQESPPSWHSCMFFRSSPTSHGPARSWAARSGGVPTPASASCCSLAKGPGWSESGRSRAGDRNVAPPAGPVRIGGAGKSPLLALLHVFQKLPHRPWAGEPRGGKERGLSYPRYPHPVVPGHGSRLVRKRALPCGRKECRPSRRPSGRGDRKVPPPGTPACFPERSLVLTLSVQVVGKDDRSMGFLPPGSASEYPASSHQRHFGDHGGLQGQGTKVLRVQIMDVGLAAGPGQHLDLRVHGLEEVGHPIGRFVDGQPRHEVRILGGDPHGTEPGVAVMAGIGLGPQLVVVLNVNRLVAVEGDEEGGPHCRWRRRPEPGPWPRRCRCECPPP